LAWALLGPSIVVVVQVEALFAIGDAFGAFPLRSGASPWAVGAAVAVFLLVCSAQVAAWALQSASAARERLDDSRLNAENWLAEKLSPPARTGSPSAGAEDAGGESADASVSDRRSERYVAELSESLLRERRVPPAAGGSTAERPPLSTRVRSLLAGEVPAAAQAVERFGLEPTWAYQVLNDLGLAEAVRIRRQYHLLDARYAGAITAVVTGALSAAGLLAALAASDYAHGGYRIAGVVVVVASVLPFTLSYLRFFRSLLGRSTDEGQFYLRVARLLEAQRFELYRALSLPLPANAREEQQMTVARWRLQRGNVGYAIRPPAAAQDDAGIQAQDLADLLRGPQLVPYEGFLSWEVSAARVQLTFAGTAVTGATESSPIHVEGVGTDTHAPFTVTANSRDVSLAQVRAAVEAPVDGRPVSVLFTFTGQPGRSGDAVIWLEIRQRGRFIQLLRVEVPASSPANA
jgi:hypothetical protein